MKNLKTISLTVFSCILLACACEKPEAPFTLPEATQEGANTFGCKVNGVNWIAFGPFGGLYDNNKNPQAVVIDRTLGFGAVAKNNDISTNEEIGIEIFNFHGEGTYTSKSNHAHIYFRDTDKGCEYYADYKDEQWQHIVDSITAKLNIPQPQWQVNVTKYDTINQFVSGTFNMSLINLSVVFAPYTDTLCDTLVYISDGRFDITLNPEN